MLRMGILVLALGAVLAVRPSARARQVMYVGTYTGSQSQGIYAFQFDDASGALEPVGLVAETPNPSFLTASADGRHLFAVNETSSFDADKSGSVTSFAIDRATLKLATINVVSSRGADPCHLMLDGTGRFLAVANYTGGSFAILPVGPDGRLGAATAVLTHTGSGPNRQRQEKPHAHMVLFEPSNRFLLGADLGLDRVHVYRFAAASGRGHTERAAVGGGRAWRRAAASCASSERPLRVCDRRAGVHDYELYLGRGEGRCSVRSERSRRCPPASPARAPRRRSSSIRTAGSCTDPTAGTTASRCSASPRVAIFSW